MALNHQQLMLSVVSLKALCLVSYIYIIIKSFIVVTEYNSNDLPNCVASSCSLFVDNCRGKLKLAIIIIYIRVIVCEETRVPALGYA